MAKRNLVAHALKHPTRRRIIEALWHSGEPLSAAQLHSEYVDDGQVPLSMIGYHLRQLELDGITQRQGLEVEGEQQHILSGTNTAEAIRRLELKH